MWSAKPSLGTIPVTLVAAWRAMPKIANRESLAWRAVPKITNRDPLAWRALPLQAHQTAVNDTLSMGNQWCPSTTRSSEWR